MACRSRRGALSRRWLLLGAMLGAVMPLHAEGLHLERAIPLPGVEGRIDHLGLDRSGHRLFVAALGNNTVEVVDLEQNRVARSLTGFAEPQGVCFVPEFNLLAVANGGDGRCQLLDGTSLIPVASLVLSGDADNVRYDASHKEILVGYGEGGLAIIDPASKSVVATTPLDNHPEAFQIEAATGRAFVNVPSSHQVRVLDLQERKAIASCPLGLEAENFPMALDEAHHRLFVGCRFPARLVVFDTATGKKVATVPLHGDCDDLFYDASRKQVYASCGEGFLDVVAQSDADHYAASPSVPTASGARTCFFDGDGLYLAVPRRNGAQAEVRVYRP